MSLTFWIKLLKIKNNEGNKTLCNCGIKNKRPLNKNAWQKTLYIKKKSAQTRSCLGCTGGAYKKKMTQPHQWLENLQLKRHRTVKIHLEQKKQFQL